MRQAPPAIDRIAAMYAGFISAGFTLHNVGGAIEIQPAERVTEAARRMVQEHEAELIAHLQTLPAYKAPEVTMIEAPEAKPAKTLNQAQQDALALLLPPNDFLDGASKLIANKLARGENVSKATLRWLYRVQMTRMNVFGPEVKQLTVEEWGEIVEALENGVDDGKPN